MGDFQFLLNLDLLGISFHAVVVFGMCKDLLFKSVLGRCVPSFFMDNNLFTTGVIRSHKILHVSREFLAIKTRKKKGFW